MEDYVLPESLILDVLSRLPVKTIVRCKCVCKKWRDLVSDTYFVDLHLSRSRPCLMFHQYKNPHPILVFVEVEHEVDYDRLTIGHVKSLDLGLIAFRSLNQIFEVGSINGLICLRHEGYAIYIFNPVVVEEYMILPELTFLDCFSRVSYGFGVSMGGEYKVIRIIGRRIPEERFMASVEIEVYTLGTDQWRTLGQSPYHIQYRGLLVSGVFVNSHVYWFDYIQIYDFDLDTETFELIPPPAGLGDDHESKQMLGVLKGSLSLFSGSSLGFNVWVMKESSWHKAIAIRETIDPIFRSQGWKPLCLIDGLNGTSILILCVKEDRENVVGYCLNTNKILDLNIPGNYWMVISTYRPSFIKTPKLWIRES
ncbi:putative F-box domain, kelch-type beta propeller, F-box associated interaction [Helianthus annuus]|nr:putative F-box domain, kelch-type beta propeller, F-box associated interaction [Helianthus annuus]